MILFNIKERSLDNMGEKRDSFFEGNYWFNVSDVNRQLEIQTRKNKQNEKVSV